MALLEKPILNRYLPQSFAGEGGFATVYVAKDLLMQRKVAVKVIELSEIDTLRAEWVREGLLHDGEAQAQAAQRQALSEHAQDIVEQEYSPYTATPSINLLNRRADGTHPTISLLSDEGQDSETRELEQRYLAQIPGLDEARTAAALNDPNIVTVYDCQIDDNKVYLIMEYVDGMTLTEFQERYDDALTLNIIAYVVNSIGQALRVAHAQGVLHLDIKPDNVLIDTQGNIKVTDFGLATLVDSQGEGRASGGTIGYMPLEQMCRRELDARTDEWALASIAYELLVGSNPFDAPDLEAAKRAVVGQELTLPSLCWDGLTEDVDDLLFDALDPNMANRLPSVAEFADSLVAELGDPAEGRQELLAALQAKEVADEEPEAKHLGFFARLFGGKSSKKQSENQDKQLDLRTAQQMQIDYQNGNAARAGYDGAQKAPAVEADHPWAVFKKSLKAAPATRVLAAVLTLLLTALSLWNIPDTTGLANPLFWGVSVGFALVAAVKPNAGSLLGFGAFSVALIVNKCWVLGALFIVALLVWWWLAARHENSASLAAMLFPMLGAFGMSPVAAVFAGYKSSVPRALATALFGSFASVICASFGSGNVMNWEALVFFQYGKHEIYANLFQVLQSPFTWFIVISWVLAALAFSLLCIPRKRVFDVIGALLAATIIMAGVWFAVQFIPGTTGMIPEMQYLVPVIIAAVVAVFAAVVW